VVEAVAEIESIEVDVLRQLDDVVVSGEALLATSTSSIPVMKLARTTRPPTKVVGVQAGDQGSRRTPSPARARSMAISSR
jgi:3-hydroxyacyl-CoA dehydrogenase